MPIFSHTDASRDLTIFAVSGPLRYSEVLAEVKNFYAGETTRFVLWDFLKTTANRISPEQAEKLLLLKERYDGKLAEGKTAIVAQNNFFYGLSRTLALQSNLQEARYTIMVFNNRETAHKWFDEP